MFPGNLALDTIAELVSLLPQVKHQKAHHAALSLPPRSAKAAHQVQEVGAEAAKVQVLQVKVQAAVHDHQVCHPHQTQLNRHPKVAPAQASAATADHL